MPERLDLPDPAQLVRFVTGVAKDATYVAVGLGVLGLQRLRAESRAAQHRIAGEVGRAGVHVVESRVGDLRTGMSRHADQLDEAVESAMRRVETTLEPLEAQLSPQAQAVAKAVHHHAHEMRTRVHDLLRSRHEGDGTDSPPSSQGGTDAPPASQDGTDSQ